MNGPERDLRGHVGRLLGGTMPLQDFRHWFASAFWTPEETADDATLAYAYVIENRLAGYGGGHITAAELLAALREDAVESVRAAQAPSATAVGVSPVWC